MRQWLWIMLFICCNKIFAQDTISYSKMSVSQYKSWEEIEKKWRTEQFMPFLKKNNIQMNCGSCTSVYAWVVFKRDSLNTSYSILQSKKCSEIMKGKFLSDFQKIINLIILPDDFLNFYFKVYLGNGLKC